MLHWAGGAHRCGMLAGGDRTAPPTACRHTLGSPENREDVMAFGERILGSNRALISSNSVSGHATRILKIADQRLGPKSRSVQLKMPKFASQRPHHAPRSAGNTRLFSYRGHGLQRRYCLAPPRLSGALEGGPRAQPPPGAPPLSTLAPRRLRAMGTCVCRAVDRNDPSRVRWTTSSCWRGASAPDPARICSLLQYCENAPVIGPECASLSPCVVRSVIALTDFAHGCNDSPCHGTK